MNVDEGTARGEYRFSMDVASQANAIALERKNWMDLLNLFSGLTGIWQQVYQQPPNLAALAGKLLTRGYNIQNPEEIVPGMNAPSMGNPLEELLSPANKGAAGEGGMEEPEGGGGPEDLLSQAGGRAAPSVDGEPAIVEEAGQGGQAALPRAFNEPAASPSQEGANAETV